ncbi:XRE family transcriptional regulator [Lactiplantibacillus garii]|uniref:XRE family transcriptional regulator n=1 Tax=Lactiplantibacillus garii TaxID=2306423 RepID=A0A426DB74_9LACO|nr:helix-turn-helix transcriptional regulator [Lactiplantibacillus garii]RRK11842.1 XRE family transcriptional regulator [Lactiplantibacillus garii]
MDLGTQLKREREARGWTQQSLADQLHVTRQTVSRWENGSTYPNLDTLVALSDHLAVSLDTLLKAKRVTVAPVVQQISRDVRLKRRYQRWLVGLICVILLISGGLGLLSWGHRYQNSLVDRYNPFLTTKRGYAVLPASQTTQTVDAFVADDPFGAGSWLKLTTGQHGTKYRWALVQHRGASVSGIRLVTRKQIPGVMREQAGNVYLKYHFRQDGPRASWKFWD